MVRGSKKQTKAGFGGAVRRLFRQAVKALTRREPVPAPKKSTRRGGDTGRDFIRAAGRITRRRTRQAGATAMLWLSDTLDWLDLWHPTAGSSEPNDDHPASRPNHLSPRR